MDRWRGPDARRQTVYVADDDPDFRIAVGDVLAEEGFDPVLFSSAQTLLSSLDDGIPALIVTDVVMPGLSGAQLLGALRGNDRWRGIPVVVMTGTNDTALPIRLEAPIVYKPDTDELLRVVHTVLRGATGDHPGDVSAPSD
jgi:FixJ family two-component response regulator